MNKLTTTTGYIDAINEMVAEAGADLPAFTQQGDYEFLRAVTAIAIEAFWHNYLVVLPEEAARAYFDSQEQDNARGLMAWAAQYANFEKDEAARSRAQKILEDLSIALPDLLKREFASYRSQMQPSL